VARSNSGRRGRSRKRRRKPTGPQQAPAGAEETPPSAHQSPRSGRPAARAPRRDRGRVGDLKPADDRPQAPWHPLPLSELLILVGAIGLVVAWLRGIQSNGALVAAAIAAVAVGTVEFTLREHLSGFRSHTLLLAVIPGIVFHSAVLLLVLAVSNHVTRWLNVALLPIDLALVAFCFKLLRARYVDARRERTFAGMR
jgi:hypothetical protein